jgi:hypothetical protein
MSPLNPNCNSTEIAVYMYFGGRKLPICWGCWREIAGSDLEWSVEMPKDELGRRLRRAKKKTNYLLTSSNIP